MEDKLLNWEWVALIVGLAWGFCVMGIAGSLLKTIEAICKRRS